MFAHYQVCILKVYKVKAPVIFNPFAKATWQWRATVTSFEGEYDYEIAASKTFMAYGRCYPKASATELDQVMAARDAVRAELLRHGWEPMDTREYEQTWRKARD